MSYITYFQELFGSIALTYVSVAGSAAFLFFLCLLFVSLFCSVFYSLHLLGICLDQPGMASSLLLAVVFVFDLIAFGLAVAAEQRRNTATLGTNNEGRKYCLYDSDIATALGVGSLFILVASQVIIMVVARCLCCGKAMRPSGSRSWAICLFITSWVTFIIAASCLLAGSVRNAYHTKYRDIMGESAPSCETLRKGVFAAGAAFIVLTGIVSELYYVSFSKANSGGPPPYARDSGVRMSNL